MGERAGTFWRFRFIKGACESWCRVMVVREDDDRRGR